MAAIFKSVHLAVSKLLFFFLCCFCFHCLFKVFLNGVFVQSEHAWSTSVNKVSTKWTSCPQPHCFGLNWFLWGFPNWWLCYHSFPKMNWALNSVRLELTQQIGITQLHRDSWNQSGRKIIYSLIYSLTLQLLELHALKLTWLTYQSWSYSQLKSKPVISALYLKDF